MQGKENLTVMKEITKIFQALDVIELLSTSICTKVSGKLSWQLSFISEEKLLFQLTDHEKNDNKQIASCEKLRSVV